MEHASAAFGAFPYQNNPWNDAASMKRSSSQSTTCTVDSGYYSTGRPSVKTGFTEPDTCDQPLVDRNQEYLYEAQPTDQLLSATGSQYQYIGQQIPAVLQFISPLQLFDSVIPSIEEAARQGTDDATILIMGAGGPLFISDSAILEALSRRQEEDEESALRAAIQDVLYQHLCRQFNGVEQLAVDTAQILEEAAYQLQRWIQGPRKFDICYCAICATLVQLRGDLGGSVSSGTTTTTSNPTKPTKQRISRAVRIPAQPSPAQPPRPSEAKERYPCLTPGCEQKAFSRSADLDRHYKMKHLTDDQKKRFLCDYRRCPRHKNPFYRQDHFRDHLRLYHKEDLLRRGNSADEEWWASRSRRAMEGGWWRCNRCLVVRVDVEEDGWTCPGCGHPCEAERQRYRVGRELI